MGISNTGITRVLLRIKKTEGGCWEWLGRVNNYGYGVIQIGGRRYGAHRVAYELLMGEIGEGQEVHHECGNRKCVNPKHMELVSKEVHPERHLGSNILIKKREQTQCVHGHEFDEGNTYWKSNGARDCKKCRADRVKKSRARRGKGVEVELHIK